MKVYIQRKSAMNFASCLELSKTGPPNPVDSLCALLFKTNYIHSDAATEIIFSAKRAHEAFPLRLYSRLLTHFHFQTMFK